MSLLKKIWKIQNENPKFSAVEKLLSNRGLRNKEEIKNFMEPSLDKMHDPFLMKDMDRAVARVRRALDKKERIIIFGDYDVDGVSATAILLHTLRQIGANVSYRLPHRVRDGYGLNKKFVDDFIEARVALVITVDCGIACDKEISLLAKKGIDTIITDHHSIPEKLPKACAILHPLRYPFSGLTGAGVAFKLAKALFKTFLPKNEYQKKVEELLDLATMGTVADMGPLIGENRIIVKHGLNRFKNTSWPGLALLRESAGISDREMDTTAIGYHLAPRLNAAGRLSSPYFALSLFTETSEKVPAIVKKLEKLNRDRQKITEESLKEAVEMAKSQERDRHAIIVWKRDWHPGIIGLIAGKLAEHYNRPAFVLTGDEIRVGSARSSEFFNTIEALKKHQNYFEHFGGHAQAGGFSMHKNLFIEFQNQLWQYAHKRLIGLDLKPVLSIDCDISAQDLTSGFFEEIEKFKPFGMMNAEPVFALRNAKIFNLKTVGAKNKHLKMQIEIDGKTLSAIGFNLGNFAYEIAENPKTWDIAFNLRKNTWNGKTTLEFNIIDCARPN